MLRRVSLSELSSGTDEAWNGVSALNDESVRATENALEHMELSLQKLFSLFRRKEKEMKMMN